MTHKPEPRPTAAELAALPFEDLEAAIEELIRRQPGCPDKGDVCFACRSNEIREDQARELLRRYRALEAATRPVLEQCDGAISALLEQDLTEDYFDAEVAAAERDALRALLPPLCEGCGTNEVTRTPKVCSDAYCSDCLKEKSCPDRSR